MGQPNRFGKLISAREAMACVSDGYTLMYGGFGGVGTPPLLIQQLLEQGTANLRAIGNDAGAPEIGIGRLIAAGRVDRLIASHIGLNPVAGERMHQGDLDVEICPQGTLAERIRAGGVGLGGVLVDVGLDSPLSGDKPVLELDGRRWLVERPLRADVALVYARRADEFGNLVYDKTARNFNPLVAMAAAITIVQAEEVVPLGSLDPEEIVTPGIFVRYIVHGQGGAWRWRWEPQ